MTRAGLRAALGLMLLLSWARCADATSVYAGSDSHPATPRTEVEGGMDPAGAAAPPIREEPTPVSEPADAGTADSGTEPPPPVCAPGSADCDGDAGNGCEVDLTTDREHCGTCDVGCSSPECVCENGTLAVSCPSGRGDCDGDLQNGCETDLLVDTDNCGDCGVRCPDNGFGVATATCQQGACGVTCQIPALRGDCDGDPQNGCETDLYHDEANCSTCGKRCNVCADGRCL